ncbi:MAG: serine/threonine protein kinase [Planctomycetota bacterium]|nr:MAG: serine/threonine protein kinase [Planctomycetota bacterium]
MSAAPDDPRATLRRVVAEFLERRDAVGEAAALAEACARHPELADAIRRRTESLRAMGMLGAPALDVPARLGDFRLLRRLGGGGMGVVYEAEQESLRRRVALKILRAEQVFSPGSAERFRREAEAAARLQHPGIVAVYGYGEAGGISYIAMELIEGRTLAELLAERRAQQATFSPAWERACLQMARDAAEALDHAHRRGVVHRDIKPSNLIVTPAGRLLVLDFGLAGLADAQKLTRTSSPLGSLPYMAPEQLRGDAGEAGPAVDVYALGVTLHELLAQRSPFLGETAEITRQRILAGRPQPLRRIHPGISREAEAVCGKAMDYDPAGRYATAADLARDLSNVLERRPINARRPGPLRRAQRWVQRNPPRAAAAALAAVLLIGGPLAFGWQQQQARARVQAQFERAEAGYRTAVEAVERLTAAAQEDLSHDPRLDPVRRRLLEDALGFHLSFLQEEGARPEASAQTAAAHLRAAQVQVTLGDRAAAVHNYQEAIALFERLPRREAWASNRLAAAHAGLAVHQSDPEQAQDHFDRALVLLAGLAGTDPASVAQLARTHSAYASLLISRGQVEPGAQQLQLARDLLQPRLAADPEDADARGVLAEVYLSLAALRLTQQGSAASEEFSRACIALFEDAQAGALPPVLHVSHGIAWSKLGDAHRLQGRWPEAADAYRSAIEILDEASARLPYFPRARLELGDACRLLGGVLVTAGRYDEAQPALARAVELQQDLAADFPANHRFQSNLGQAHAELARLHEAQGRLQEAESALAAAVAILERVATAQPQDLETHYYLARQWRSLGRARSVLGRREEAEAALQCSVAAFESLIQKMPAMAYLPGELATTLVALGAWFAEGGRTQEAQVTYERAAAALDGLPPETARRADYSSLRGHVDAELAALLIGAGELEPARVLVPRALAAQEARLAAAPETPGYRQRLAVALVTAAELELADGHPERAVEHAERALTLLVERKPLSSRLAAIFTGASAAAATAAAADAWAQRAMDLRADLDAQP